MDANDETFVVHVVIQEREEMIIDLGRKVQIEAQSGAQVGALLFDEAPTEISAEYFDYSDVFLAENAAKLPEYTGINEHAIELEKDKQSPFGPIYSLGLVGLKTLKTYIETNLANVFIRPSKFPAGVPIFFDQKRDGSLRLCVDYWGLNNITIQNRYLLPLIRESFNELGRAKRFTQLNLTNTYHQMRICEDVE